MRQRRPSENTGCVSTIKMRLGAAGEATGFTMPSPPPEPTSRWLPRNRQLSEPALPVGDFSKPVDGPTASPTSASHLRVWSARPHQHFFAARRPVAPLRRCAVAPLRRCAGHSGLLALRPPAPNRHVQFPPRPCQEKGGYKFVSPPGPRLPRKTQPVAPGRALPQGRVRNGKTSEFRFPTHDPWRIRSGTDPIAPPWDSKPR
jgi:hypothetical protein